MLESQALLRAVTIGSLLLSVSACVKASFIPTGAVYPAKPPNCDIPVFSSAIPERPYEELGLVEGQGEGWKSDLEDVLPKLKEKACLAGGDGIILFSSDTFAQGAEGGRVQRVTATVIRWKQNRY